MRTDDAVRLLAYALVQEHEARAQHNVMKGHAPRDSGCDVCHYLRETLGEAAPWLLRLAEPA